MRQKFKGRSFRADVAIARLPETQFLKPFYSIVLGLWPSPSWYSRAAGAPDITPTLQRAGWRKEEERLFPI